MATTAQLDALAQRLLPGDMLSAALQLWLEEDGFMRGDVTSRALCGKNASLDGSITSRATGVLAGMQPLVRAIEGSPMFEEVSLVARVEDGASIDPGTVIAKMRGPAPDVLGLERPLLNLLGRLCGVASLSRRFVDAIDGTQASICTTRKTTPGLRRFEKYAAACGGATLHRLGLDDAALFKDNHIAGIPDGAFTERMTEACRRARDDRPLAFVEIEVDTLEQFNGVLAIEAGLVDMILLDNFDLDMLREAVKRRDVEGSAIALEASGGVTLESVRQIAETGVDRISVGALTHQAVSLDVGLDVA
ncbi:MAG: carboxylating nicotinate-nucleotide diphosphorylase [Phycisphaerales bacterium]|nr:carboxylating nicotinate-nucleotide diphosphorylase [Phycisphaerales bacterium]